jgi:rhodanese-related sulfurtransferase
MKYFVIAVLAALTFTACTSARKTPDISMAELQSAMKQGKVVLLDANGSEIYNAGHIPGAIDVEAAGSSLATKLPSDKSTLIVAYCGGPKCLAYQKGTTAALNLGYTNVKHFSAGISGWKEAGGAVETAPAAKGPKAGAAK